MEIDKLYHLFFSFINHPQIEAKKRGRIKLYLGFNSLRNSKRSALSSARILENLTGRSRGIDMDLYDSFKNRIGEISSPPRGEFVGKKR